MDYSPGPHHKRRLRGQDPCVLHCHSAVDWSLALGTVQSEGGRKQEEGEGERGRREGHREEEQRQQRSMTVFPLIPPQEDWPPPLHPLTPPGPEESPTSRTRAEQTTGLKLKSLKGRGHTVKEGSSLPHARGGAGLCVKQGHTPLLSSSAAVWGSGPDTNRTPRFPRKLA